jgi:proteasomal ATPase-associated factor 1
MTGGAGTALQVPLRKIPKLHLSTLTSLHFFPSSRVLLTAGADFTLMIFPADPPTDSSSTASAVPVRTLKGHTHTITATTIISRGRNVVSAAKDGTVQLWDVSSGTQICSIGMAKGKYTLVKHLM